MADSCFQKLLITNKSYNKTRLNGRKQNLKHDFVFIF